MLVTFLNVSCIETKILLKTAPCYILTERNRALDWGRQRRQNFQFLEKFSYWVLLWEVPFNPPQMAGSCVYGVGACVYGNPKILVSAQSPWN